MATVVLAKMKHGQVDEWNRLDQVWALWNDKAALGSYVRNEISHMLEAVEEKTPEEVELASEISDASAEPLDIPVPETINEEHESNTVVAAVDNGESAGDGLVVHYFHATDRCPTCQKIESQSRAAVHSEFAPQLASGEVVWQPLNYEEPAAAPLAALFDIQWPVVVLAKVKGGQVEAWKSLDQVWILVDDKPAFTEYLRSEITRMLEGAEGGNTDVPSGDAAEIPVQSVDPPKIPIPADAADIPVPQ
jgi:hypothetical protein